MTRLLFVMALAFLLGAAAPGGSGRGAVAGRWDVTVTFANGSASGAMTIEAAAAGDALSGTSEPLDENQFFPLILKGRQGPDGGAEIDLAYRDQPVGSLRLRPDGQALAGTGALYGVPVTLAGVRPREAGLAPAGGPRTHDFTARNHHLQYSGRNAPGLRVAPGDRVRTSTLDNVGKDAAGRWRAMPGNTLTGPFHVEGAMPGDTLVVHLERVALNRDSADMYSGMLDQKAVQGGYAQQAAPGWSRTWTLDRRRGTARLASPGARLGKFELKVRPMIGSIGVAPPLNQALYAGDVWIHGGNMDYNRHVEGATIYFPVWRAGALLSLGDGHALQGDGEISGQGLETSLDVAFRVELIKGKTLGQIWSEDADWVMVSGTENSLDLSFQAATTGMARWLKEKYGLNDSEIAALMSSSIEYDIAEVVDSRPHVVARMAKRILAMLSKS